jgi:hypothetical protein
MLLLLVWDYHQWLGTDFKKSLGRAVSTGVFYGLLYVAMILLLSGTAFLIANYKS